MNGTKLIFSNGKRFIEIEILNSELNTERFVEERERMAFDGFKFIRAEGCNIPTANEVTMNGKFSCE